MSSILFLSCSQKEAIKENNFEKKLFAKIDSFQCDTGIRRLLLIRHQKMDNKDYVQIKVDYDYNLDSLAYCRENNYVFSVFYNDDYFKNKIKYDIAEKDSLLKKYDYFSNKHSGNLLYHNLCEEIYEVRNDNFIIINKNSPVYNKLFNYTSTFVPEPPPPPRK